MAAKKGQQKKESGLGLGGIGDLSNLLAEPEQRADGKPLELAVSLIDEDPEQPRKGDNPGFSKESLNELADTVAARGVKTPISVRENPETPGRYIVNHGARRLRASKLAGKKTIPAFIDNDYNETDQVIENLQRNELTAREIADFIGRELAKGRKKGEIAASLGKSASFVSQHVTLLDLPEPIARAFNGGRTKDVTLVNELVKLHSSNPEEVEAWLADDSQEIGRGSLRVLRDFLATEEPAAAGEERGAQKESPASTKKGAGKE